MMTNSGVFTASVGNDGKDDKIPLAGPQRFAVKSLGWYVSLYFYLNYIYLIILWFDVVD